MRICIVYHGSEFPRAEERIEKTAKSLSAVGHEVFLFCNNYDNYRQNEEQIGNVHVLRVRPTFRSRTLNKVVKFPVFLNPLWILQLILLVYRFRFDALQVVDIPLSAAVLYVGHAFGIPVVLDMWENYPEALRGWGKTNWKTRLFKNYRVARAVELWTTRRVDRIFVVVEEQRDRLINDGVDPLRIAVISNGVDEELFADEDLHPKAAMSDGPEAYKLLYVGAITPERGLDDIINALKHVRPALPNVRLYIAGSGPEEPRLRQLANTEDVSELVRFVGWIQFSEIKSYIAESDLCLVPHVYNDFINTTIPNKIFQYMWMKKPVLVSNARPLARVVKECSGGFIFKSGSPRDAAKQILAAYNLRNDVGIGARAHAHVRKKYTWRQCEAGLLAVYEGLFAEQRRKESRTA